MKTEIKKLDSTKREISIEVSGDIVKNKFEEVFKKIAKEAKVPGFRAGSAPRDILEKHFSSDARRHVIEELVPDVYGQALKKENLDVVDMPDISDVKLDNLTISFKATVEVKPQIQLNNYKGQKVRYEKIEVSPDEIKRNIENIKENIKAGSVDDKFAKSIGYLNLSELEKGIEKQIYIQKDNQQRQKIENEIVENIAKDLDFKIPQSLISRQLKELLRQAKLDLALKGVSREEIDSNEKSLVNELEPQAKRQIKVYLILAEVAKRENLPLDENMSRRAIEFLLKEADWVESA